MAAARKAAGHDAGGSRGHSDEGARGNIAPRAFVAWFLGESWLATAAWVIAIMALAAVLAWFFVVSPYGAPAAPIYAEF